MATYNKKDFLRHADSVIPPDFKRQGNEAYYTKRETDRELRFYFGEDVYYPHSVTIDGLSVNVSIDIVENVLDEVFEQYPIAGYGSGKNGDTIGGGGYNIPGVDYQSLGRHNVEDDASFAIIKPQLELIVQGGLQFFEDYKSLQAIHDHVATLPIRKMGTFLRQPMPARRMIVKKLIDAPDYQDYAQYVVDYNLAKEEPSPGIFFKALKDKLDGM
ncbi:MAG: hypothetical protein AAGF77_07010 [Bacteroidota bacterium]